MKARLPIALLSTLLVALPCAAETERTSSDSGTDCEVRLSLESFRAYALANSPLVAEIDRDYATQVAKAIETELLTNPELSGFQTWTRMYVDGANDPQSEVSLSQPIRLSNFGKRDKVAELLRKAGDTEKNIKLLEFSQNNTVNYVRLYSLQETVRVLQLAERDAGTKLETVRKHVREGLLSQGSEALFQGEKARLEAQRAGAQAELAMLQSELAM